MDATKNKLKLKPALKRESTSEAPSTPPKVHLLEKRLIKARDVFSASYNGENSKKRMMTLKKQDF